MNKASFLSLVRQASRISDQEVEELEKLIVNFPYCQTAHLLIAKAAYDKGSMLSNQKLKKAAIYAANRQLLKKLIYTSDATVALQPVTPEATFVQTPAAATLAEPKTSHIPVDSQPIVSSLISEEKIEAAKDFVEAVVETETLSEPATLLETEIPVPEIEILNKETSGFEAGKSETETEIVAEIIAQSDYEDAAIAEEILEEGYLPKSEATFLAASEIGTPTEIHEKTETHIVKLAEKESFPENKTSVAETKLKFTSETKLETGVPTIDLTEVENLTPETVSESAEKVGETEILIPEEAILAEEIAIAEDFEQQEIKHPEIAQFIKEPEISETVSTEKEQTETLESEVIQEPEIVAENSDLEITEEGKSEPLTEELEYSETQQTPVLNDELLHETLANFDQYLFKPEKETEEIQPKEDVKVVVPLTEIESIYAKDSIGYWMNSSRMGESLEFKNELTTQQPHDFHPELIWEYNKTHELQKEIKPVASKLSHQLDIIDNFLKMTPRLKAMAHQKVKTEAQEDLSSKSSKISKNLASENFANILIQQGKIKKAIKIYEHLILKIPEKKAYFVSQIEKLQNPE